MKYKLAIFDLDGTILNTLEDLKNSLNFALGQYSLPPRSISQVRAFVGNGIRKLIERGVPDGTPPDITERVFESFNTHYAIHCADTTGPYDGIENLLSVLRKNGMSTAVVSNKSDYAVQALTKKYFDGLFDIAVGAKENVRKKPYPDSVNEVIRLISVHKSNCVYIGDSEVDIETAKNANISCISVDWGFRNRQTLINAGASIILSDCAALLKELIGK